MSLKFGSNNHKDSFTHHNSTGYFHNPEDSASDSHADTYGYTSDRDTYDESHEQADGREERRSRSSRGRNSKGKWEPGGRGDGGSGHRRGPTVMLVVLAAAAAVLGCFLALNVFTDSSDGRHDTTIADREEEQVKAENGDYYIRPASDTINYDKEAHLNYYDRMLVVYLERKLSDSEVDDLISKVDGELTGKLSGIMNVLQIRIPDSGYNALNKAAKTLMEEGTVTYAHEDYPVEYEPDEISGKDTNPWRADSDSPCSFDENYPRGNNWWAEAVGAYTAWKYTDAGYGSDYTLGIVDTGVQLDHPDLREKVRLVDEKTFTNTASDHGTAVAGIMAAENNNVGIRGIADQATLLAADYEDAQMDSLDNVEMNKRMVESGCCVINNSYGIDISSIPSRVEYANDQNPFKMTYRFFTYDLNAEEDYENYIEDTIEEIAQTGRSALIMIHQLLLAADTKDAPENIKKKKFLFVQAAGNGYDNNGSTGYDAKYNGAFCSVSLAKDVYSSDLKSLFDDISYNEIRSHIMIVGSAKNSHPYKGGFDQTSAAGYLTQINDKENVSYEEKVSAYRKVYEIDTYRIDRGACYGDEVDIYAPGVDISSTKNNSSYNIDDKEESKSGTSYAAPMVAASAGLLWSLNPELTVEEVREYLLQNSSRVTGTPEYKTGILPGDDNVPGRVDGRMLNIGKAAEALMKDTGHTEEFSPGSGDLQKDFTEYLNNELIPGKGLMSTDPWKLEAGLNPFEQGSLSGLNGILSARIGDFDSDSYYEMLVVRFSSTDFYSADAEDSAEMYLEMYEFADGEIKLKDTMTFSDAGDICRDSFTWRTAVFISDAEHDPCINIYAFNTSGNDVETETVRIVKYENGSFRTKNLLNLNLHWDGGLQARWADNMTDDHEASFTYDSDIRKDGRTKGSIVESDDCGGTESGSSGDLSDKSGGSISANELRGQILDKYYDLLSESGAEHRKVFPDRFSLSGDTVYGADGYEEISGADFTVRDLFSESELSWICELDNRYGADGENIIVPIDYTGLKRTDTQSGSDS